MHTLCSILSPSPRVVFNEYATMMDTSAITAAGERHAARKLGAIADKLKGRSIKVQSAHATGVPVSLILEKAAEEEPDYIVMGSHGHTALYDLLVGSTTHGVLKRAKCPVVIVSAAAAKPKRRRKPRNSTK